MAVLLEKGEGVNLEKTGSGRPLTQVTVGLGWTAKKRPLGPEFDLDASAFALNRADRAPSEEWFVFYGNLNGPNRVIVHHGDDLVGGDGKKDDEQITIRLIELPDDIVKIVLPVTIYKAEERRQNFGQVEGAFIRIVDVSGAELARYDLREEFSSETCVIFGALTREGSNWRFQALGEPFQGGLRELCMDAGIGVKR